MKTGPRWDFAPLLPVKSTGHAKLEKKGQVSLELKLEGLSSADDRENLLPAGILNFSQTLVQDQALQNPGPQYNLPKLAAQGFHFG
jgi:hypothetical protein